MQVLAVICVLLLTLGLDPFVHVEWLVLGNLLVLTGCLLLDLVMFISYHLLPIVM